MNPIKAQKLWPLIGANKKWTVIKMVRMNKTTEGMETEKQVGYWLGKLTLHQKIALVVGRGMDFPGLLKTEDPTKVAGQAGSSYEVKELGIPAIIMADGPARAEPAGGRGAHAWPSSSTEAR